MSNVRGVFLAMRQLEPSSTATSVIFSNFRSHGAQQRSFFERGKGGTKTTIEPL
jgi:hypothetical protein